MPFAGCDLGDTVAGIDGHRLLAFGVVPPDNQAAVGLQRNAEHIAGGHSGHAAGHAVRQVIGGPIVEIGGAPRNKSAVGFQRQGVPFTRRNGRHAACRRRGHIPDAICIFIGGLDSKDLHAAVGCQCYAEVATPGHLADAAVQRGGHRALAVGVRTPRHHTTLLHRQGVVFSARHLGDAAGQRRRHIGAHDADAPGHDRTVGLDRQTEPAAAGDAGNATLCRNRDICLIEAVVAPGPDPPAFQREVVMVAGGNSRHIRHRIGGHRIEFLVLPP